MLYDHQKSRMILSKYIKNYAKSLGEVGSGEHYDGMPAYHPATTDLTADAKTLSVGEGMSFCKWCDDTVKRMVKAGFDVEGYILANKFMLVRPKTDFAQYTKLNMSSRKFYYMVKKALTLFSDVTPTYVFNQLFDQARPKLNDNIEERAE